MKISERHLLLACALLCLPLMLLFLSAMILARFGRPKRGVTIVLSMSDRWPAYLQYMRLPYDLAILRAGGRVKGIYPGMEGKIPDILDSADAVVISGGEDIALPIENPKAQSPAHNLRRDAMELELLREAEKRNMPMLCVCRGMQLFALAHGGSIASLDNNTSLSQTHTSTLRNLRRHKIAIDESSMLKTVLGASRVNVNSIHHQHVSDPGSLKVSARAEDQIIEALEDTSANFAIGVQWHPELAALVEPRGERLFSALLDAAVTYKKS